MNISTMQILSIWVYLFGLVACSNHTANNNPSTAADNASLSSSDTSVVSKEELTTIYSQSIARYIKAVNSEYKIAFDTLYFGKRASGQPDDFPDIELPATIENTQIRLVAPEFGSQKQRERKSSFYINLIGWVNRERAEFIFVTFSNGLEHQFDCFINYKYDPKSKEFESEALRFQNYLFKKKD